MLAEVSEPLLDDPADNSPPAEGRVLPAAAALAVMPAVAAVAAGFPAVATILVLAVWVGIGRHCRPVVPLWLRWCHRATLLAWAGAAGWLLRQNPRLPVQMTAVAGGGGVGVVVGLAARWPERSAVRSGLLAAAYVVAAVATLLLLVCT